MSRWGLPFGGQKEAKNLFEVSCCVFYGVPPWALLLSSPKEVSKKGAVGNWMNGIQPVPPSFLDTQKGSEKSATVEAGFFTAGRRGALLLSSPKEVSKKGAVGNWMNGIQPVPPSFLDTQKGSEKSATVEAGLFTACRRRVLLLSSLKEVSKKGATVSTRWTPTRGNPWTPHSGTLTGCYPYRLLPGPPCGPGVQVLPLG